MTNNRQRKKAVKAAHSAVPSGLFGGSHADWASALVNSSSKSVSQAIPTLAPNPTDFGALLPAGAAHGPSQVAAEQVGHMLDGWRFLSSSLYACLTNSPSNVIHYAYYAELRAAFSLMAATGLRVRYKDSYYLDPSGAAHPLGTWSTHDCVWKVWPEWLKRQDVIDRFLESFKFHPVISLRDLMAALNSHVGSAVFKSWGLDILAPLSDHDHRNNASYQSTVVTQDQADLSEETMIRFRKAWDLMLPGGNSLRFDESLSAYLLYKALESRTGVSDTTDLLNLPMYDRVAESLSRQFGVSKSYFFDVVRNNAESFELFDLASDQSDASDNVLMRALFLLRVASAFVSVGVPSAGAARDRLKGWLERVGLWSRAQGGMVADLAQDFEDALSDLPAPVSVSDLCGLKIDSAGMKLTRADAVVAWAV